MKAKKQIKNMPRQSLFEVTLKDGRIYRVYCANKTQRLKLFTDVTNSPNIYKSLQPVISGIHDYTTFKRHHAAFETGNNSKRVEYIPQTLVDVLKASPQQQGETK